MEDLMRNLKKQGWNLSEEKLQAELQDEEGGDAEKKKFLKDPEKWVLDQDLKAIGSPFLPDGINSGKISQLSCPAVLQVKKVDIISAPQKNIDSQAAPRMLKISLTDGKVTCYGIEYDHIPRLSMKTPPGTKIKLMNNARLSHGFLLLDNKNVHVLGGEVPYLMDDWKIQQSLIGYIRASNLENGPPPWVPFGQKVRGDHIVDTKTLKEPVVDKEEKDEGFLNQRQDAIAAAAHSGEKKIFKGSGKQMDIQQPERGRGRSRGEGGRRGRDRESREEMAASRPRDSIRLFEFLQPQIGADEAQHDLQGEQSTDYDASYDHGQYSDHAHGHQRRSGHGNSFGDRRGSGGYADREGSFDDRRGRGRYGDREGSFDDRRGRGRYGDHEGSHGRGRGRSRGGRGRGQQGGTFRDRGERDYYSSSSCNPVDTLIDDFNAWPGLGGQDPDPVSAPAPRQQPAVRNQTQWQIEDYCLAKWDSSKDYPAIVQGISADGQSATVMFVETGAFRTIDIKNLKRDPGDCQQIQQNSAFLSNRTGRVYTRRPNRPRY